MLQHMFQDRSLAKLEDSYLVWHSRMEVVYHLKLQTLEPCVSHGMQIVIYVQHGSIFQGAFYNVFNIAHSHQIGNNNYLS
jgi:hypothetical protein